MIKIASFNVENLFARPKAFRTTDLSVTAPILEAYREVNELFKLPQYSVGDKARMRELLVILDVYRKDAQGVIRRTESLDPKWAWLRANRGKFDVEPQDTTRDVEIVANGRGDWIGWLELAKDPTNEIGTRMTARVIQDVNADILGIVEAEDRPSLVRFNEELLGRTYAHAMLVDGNDDRGIDVGIFTRAGFDIDSICSNVDNEDSVGTIFSRDCPEYEIRTPGGATIHVLVNHFKSQSGGGGQKRKRQAVEVRRIADKLIQSGKHVVVLGDLNEGPPAGGTQATNLVALYDNNSQLLDCYSLPNFAVGDRPGSYDSCGLSNRLDYIFISQSLRQFYVAGGLFRKGLWGSRKTRPDKWDTYPEMTASIEQASDHSAVFVELDIQ
jgi:endonuclease/exonuclease/phosphatase family metal-dependent hydrolase